MLILLLMMIIQADCVCPSDYFFQCFLLNFFCKNMMRMLLRSRLYRPFLLWSCVINLITCLQSWSSLNLNNQTLYVVYAYILFIKFSYPDPLNIKYCAPEIEINAFDTYICFNLNMNTQILYACIYKKMHIWYVFKSQNYIPQDCLLGQNILRIQLKYSTSAQKIYFL